MPLTSCLARWWVDSSRLEGYSVLTVISWRRARQVRDIHSFQVEWFRHLVGLSRIMQTVLLGFRALLACRTASRWGVARQSCSETVVEYQEWRMVVCSAIGLQGSGSNWRKAWTILSGIFLATLDMLSPRMATRSGWTGRKPSSTMTRWLPLQDLLGRLLNNMLQMR